MLAAEDDFELGGHKFRAGTFIIPNANVNALRVDSGIWPFRLGGGFLAGG